MKLGPHTLIVGMTDSGKSTAARRIITEHMKPAGVEVVALDPKGDPRFMADFTTTDPAAFLAELRKRAVSNPAGKVCALIDEGGETVGRFGSEMRSVATMYRELGVRGIFIVQRGADLDKTIRQNCGNLFVFESAADDAETMAKQRGIPEIAEAKGFKQGEFIFAPRNPAHDGLRRGNIFAGLEKKG